MKRPLRRLLKFALLLLALAALFSGLRLWFDARGRAILAKYPARPHPPARPVIPGAGKAGDSVPVEKLAVFAGAFSTDPAEKAAAQTLIDEIHAFLLDGSRFRFIPPFDHDFLRVLNRLKLPVKEGMTQAEAAATFLEYAKKYEPFLAGLRTAAAGPGWDFGPPPDLNDPHAFDKFGKYFGLAVYDGSRLLEMLAEAHWLTGDSSAARADWQCLVDLSNQPRKTDPWRDYGTVNSTKQLVEIATRGFALGAWRNEDLAPVARDLAAADCLDEMRSMLHLERFATDNRLAGYTMDRSALRAAFSARENAPFGSKRYWEEQAQQLALSFVSDTQIAANATIIDHRFQVLEDQFNYRDRTYLPPDPAEINALWARSNADDPLQKSYFFLADDGSSFGSYDCASYAWMVIRDQSNLDQTALALALEAQKRATGSYPDSLDALTPVFPGGVPHDIATGQPYSYQKKPDGAFRLWGTGKDQTNHGGDPQKDILWKLEKPQ